MSYSRHDKMISLCLQTYPGDVTACGELVDIICDWEPQLRQDGEFFLIYRRDVHHTVVPAFEERARRKFARVKACMARNFAVGHAEGCNSLAMSAFMEMSILAQQGICKNDGFLLFEPDCVPLEPNWLDVLSGEWELAKSLGKEAIGHWHQMHAPEYTHLNGNAIFRTDFYNRHANMMGGPGTMGWDFWHRSAYVALSMDTSMMFQLYACPHISCQELDWVRKNDLRPVFLHGVKDDSARACIRQKLLSGVSASKSG